MALLSIRKLHKQYGSVTAIQSLDLDLEKGEVIVLLVRLRQIHPPALRQRFGSRTKAAAS
ncbi:hypothetical protein ACR30T_07260 [Neisseria gonorrhoeae]